MSDMSAEIFDAVKEEVKRFRNGLQDPTMEERESGENFVDSATERLRAVYDLNPAQQDRVRRQLRASYYQLCSDLGSAVVPVGTLTSRTRKSGESPSRRSASMA